MGKIKAGMSKVDPEVFSISSMGEVFSRKKPTQCQKEGVIYSAEINEGNRMLFFGVKYLRRVRQGRICE